MSIDYDKALSYSYNVACKYIGDSDKAQDVAQLAAIQLFLNSDKIDPNSLLNWLFTVTKNLCFKQFKMSQKNKEVTFEPEFLENLNIAEIGNDAYKLDFYSYDFIKQSDQELLHKYYIEQYKISDLAKAYKLKKKKLKDKIYRLSHEIILFQKMQDNVFTSSVPGTKLHNSLYYFLGEFTKALNENRIVEFSEKLVGCLIHDSINDIEIKSIRKVTIDFFSEEYYQGMIFYRNFSDELKVFLFKFKFEKGNKIKILEFPILPKLVVSHPANSIPEELKNAHITDKKGKLIISSEVLIDLANKNKIKMLQGREGILKE